MRYRFSNVIWGTFLVLAAVFVVVNQFSGFTNIGIGGIIIAILSLAFIVQCIAFLHLAALPIPLAVLYIIFRRRFDLPYLPPWSLILAAVLASAGLAALFPHSRWRHHWKNEHCGKPEGFRQQTRAEYSGNDNNPSASVSFGAVSRHLQAENLETVRLYCNFGELEIFFDQAAPCPNGAEAIINCSFGAIKLYVPRHWHIIDRLNCTLGGVDINKGFAAPGENTPRLTLSGNVSFGGIEVR